jgi:TM2 domain-containing membrane protein YozV
MLDGAPRGYAPSASYPPNYSVPQRTFNPGVAALLSFFFPGAGQIYKGKIGAGLLWFIAVPIGYFCIILPGIILHVWCVYNAAAVGPNGQQSEGADRDTLNVVIILGVIIAVVAVSAGIYAYIQIYQTPVVSDTPLPITTVEPSPSPTSHNADYQPAPLPTMPIEQAPSPPIVEISPSPSVKAEASPSPGASRRASLRRRRARR